MHACKLQASSQFEVYELQDAFTEHGPVQRLSGLHGKQHGISTVADLCQLKSGVEAAGNCRVFAEALAAF